MSDISCRTFRLESFEITKNWLFLSKSLTNRGSSANFATGGAGLRRRALLLFVGAPSLIFLWLINRREWLYPFALWGARTWLKACGARIKVTGLENLDEDESYVFISNHRSYLDTATLFAYTGQTDRAGREKRIAESAGARAGNGLCKHHRDRPLKRRTRAAVDGKSARGDGRRLFVRRFCRRHAGDAGRAFAVQERRVSSRACKPTRRSFRSRSKIPIG